MSHALSPVIGLVLMLASSAACTTRHPDSDATAGAGLFAQRCAVCHSISAAGGQGPSLRGVVGRIAGTGRGFGYSRALRSSGIVWDTQTLDRFLTSPPALVPGTTMPIAVPAGSERQELIAYLATLTATGPTANSSKGTSAGGDDYRSDAPGVRRRVLLRQLPAPFDSPSAHNGPTVVPRPEGAQPRVPVGFVIDRFAGDLEQPRQIRIAPNGDIFVAESSAGRVRLLRAADGAPTPDLVETFATGLSRPFGLAFYPPGLDPQWLYVANTNSVVRFPYRVGDLHARGAPSTVIDRLIDTEGGHWTRDVVFSPDGARMFVSVGSGSNVAQTMPVRSVAEAAAWEKVHGLGASWGSETDRADVLVFDPDGGGRRTYATGIRNCVGMTIRPRTSELWCATNERDELGDDLVPDYVTHVREGAFYGWPWYYLGANEDPRHAGERPDLATRATVPDVLFPAHSASLGIAFYDARAYPAEFRGDLFAAFHGSWNRSARRGPKVVRVHFRHGAPTGEVEDFMTGFVVDDTNVWARPVGVAIAHDGALLVTEDGNGSIWRVAYVGAPDAESP
ncbi:MAG TPA: PQQ-dependent sugar dehydrogenase [Polyangiaceae bacterium]|nr:PQQ-dependent sugar dehydrogenase [Polyangiaceae bacterium]